MVPEWTIYLTFGAFVIGVVMIRLLQLATITY
jgi:hypothetical protein